MAILAVEWDAENFYLRPFTDIYFADQELLHLMYCVFVFHTMYNMAKLIDART